MATIPWNRRNWFKYCRLISQNGLYYEATDSNFTVPNLSWREFACDFFSIPENWVIANEKTVPPNSLLCDIVHFLEQPHEICNEIVEDIDTFLGSSYVDD